ncbi:MAG: hypothetical protein FJY55_14215 [Betaproteobacteria bacterium]|nr:hypothetical protein [Betaproteobacteria bacterium]
MHYFYYSSLKEAVEDLQLLDRNDASDYSGILTIMDCAINLLVAFDSEARETAFFPIGGAGYAVAAKPGSCCACSVATCAGPGNSEKRCICTGENANCSRNCSARIHARWADA